MRSEATKKAFIKYMKEHPDERFWQAVRNFGNIPFLLASETLPKEGQEDTFFREEL